MEPRNFSWACAQIDRNKKVRRRSWPATYLPVQTGGLGGLVNVSANGGKFSWQPGDEDIAGTDWETAGSVRAGFGWALARLSDRQRVCRSGWNGKGMWIAYQAGYPDGIPINANTAKATGLDIGTVCKFRPYIMMFTAQGDFVPWLASQSDLLTDDWEITEA